MQSNEFNESPNASPERRKILVIEDEPDYRTALRLRLESQGYEVVEAENGIKGLIITRSRPPDLILLDVLLPAVSGYELAWFFKSDPTSIHIPVIMLSALSQKHDIQKGLAAGADAYLTKPCANQLLLDTISTHLQKS